MIITVYLHASKEHAYDAAFKAGLRGDALDKAMFLGYEHKIEYEVDPVTGDGVPVKIDGREITNG